MKNITKQYQDLLEGKMSKDVFIRNVRMSFPQYVSPTTSFKDAVSILKAKRVLIENRDVATDPEAQQIINKFMQDHGIRSLEDTGANDYELAMDLQKRLNDAGFNVEFDLSGGFVPMDDEKNDEEWSMEESIKMLREAKTNSGYSYVQEKATIPEIDLVNPYQLQKGVQFELSKMSDIKNNSYFEALDKALKTLAKDKDAFKDLQFANYKEVKKVDAELQMTEVGKKSKVKQKTDHSGYMKKPVKKDEASNVSVKKENKKGKPKGVKEMTNKPKKAAGISKTMEIPGKEQVLNELNSFLAKKKDSINEDMHHHYHNGMEVNTPSGRGKVSNIVGSTVTVQLDNGQAQDFQINVLDKQYRDDVFSKMPNLGASFEKGKSKLANEDKKTEVIKKLKEYFSKKKKVKEATKFNVGGDIVVKKPGQETTDFENQLKAAGAKYEKGNA